MLFCGMGLDTQITDEAVANPNILTAEQARTQLLSGLDATWQSVLGDGAHALGTRILNGAKAEWVLSLQPLGVGSVRQDFNTLDETEKARGRTNDNDPTKFAYLFGTNAFKPEQIVALCGGDANFQLRAESARTDAQTIERQYGQYVIPEVVMELGAGVKYHAQFGDFGKEFGKREWRPTYSFASVPLAGDSPNTGYGLVNQSLDTWRTTHAPQAVPAPTVPTSTPVPA